MEFYTDGSRIGTKDNYIIGWGSVCDRGVLGANNLGIGYSRILDYEIVQRIVAQIP